MLLAGITNGVLAAGVITTLGFMIHAGSGNSIGQWFVGIPFAMWAALPFVVVAVLLRRLAGSRRSEIALLVTAVLLSSSSAFFLYQAFIAHLDPQSALVLIFLPMWQFAGLVPLAAIAFALRERQRM